MKKTLFVFALILAGLAVLLPFASSNPDVLDAVTENFSSQPQSSIWQGIMPDYSVKAIGNDYTSTLIAGIAGVLVVVIASLVVSKVLVPKKQ